MKKTDEGKAITKGILTRLSHAQFGAQAELRSPLPWSVQTLLETISCEFRKVFVTNAHHLADGTLAHWQLKPKGVRFLAGEKATRIIRCAGWPALRTAALRWSSGVQNS